MAINIVDNFEEQNHNDPPIDLHLPARENNYLIRKCLIKSAFSESECEYIIRKASDMKLAAIYTEKGEVSFDKERRNSYAKYLSNDEEDGWIYKRIVDLSNDINKSTYSINLNVLRDLQLLEYRKTGCFEWHLDMGTKKISSRKISLVVFLSKRSSYEGGELCFKPELDDLPDFQQGDMIMFPSYLYHTVKPVKSGQRFSLVCWAHGKPFV